MDPVVTFEDFLKQKKWITKDHKEKLISSINQEIEEAILYAKESPEPDLKDALEDVYSDT